MFTTACWVFSGPRVFSQIKNYFRYSGKTFPTFLWRSPVLTRFDRTCFDWFYSSSTFAVFLSLSLGRCRDSASALDSLGAEEGVPINQPGVVSCVLTSLCCYFYKYFEAAAIFKPRRRSGIVNGKTNVERDRLFIFMSARVRGASRHLEWVTSDGDKQLMLVSLRM